MNRLVARLWSSFPASRGLQGVGLALCLVLLGGCASVWRVDSQVQSFAHWSEAGAGLPQPPQSYRFERLPSQQQGQALATQEALEKLAGAALARLGWSAAPPTTSPPWTVQIEATTRGPTYAYDPWWDPGSHFWAGFGGAHRWSGGAHVFLSQGGWYPWGPMAFPPPDPWYQRELSLVIRSAAQGRVAYETRAVHESRWGGSAGLWGAMVDAALRDFPQPAPGLRTVVVEVPPAAR